MWAEYEGAGIRGATGVSGERGGAEVAVSQTRARAGVAAGSLCSVLLLSFTCITAAGSTSASASTGSFSAYGVQWVLGAAGDTHALACSRQNLRTTGRVVNLPWGDAALRRVAG